MLIKSLSEEDQSFLKEMFYVSLYVPEGSEPYPISIIEEPHLAKYHTDWGKDTDLGLLAEIDGKKVGAIWGRFFTSAQPGYGFIADDIPEIGIAIREDFRGQGIGTQLFLALFSLAKKQKLSALSLSVDRRNKAYHLYHRLGFTVVAEDGNSLTMKKIL